MIRYPSGEQITVPRHIPTRNVRTTMNASAFASERLAPLFAAMVRPAGLAMRTPLKRLAQRGDLSSSRGARRPGSASGCGWMIVCEAKRGEVERKGVISGRDVYGLTAAAIAQGAMIAARRGFEATRRTGALRRRSIRRSSSAASTASTCAGTSRGSNRCFP